MEIGIISTIILLALALALLKSPAGIVVVELAKLLSSALMLALVVAVAFCRPARPALA